MSKFVTSEVLDKNKWESFLLSRKPGTFLQSWNWGEANKLTGFKIKRLGFYEGKVLVGIAQLIHQPAKRGHHFLIPGGPVIDYGNKNLLKFVTESIGEYVRKEKVWFVRIRPDQPDSEELRTLLINQGFIFAD